MKSRVRTSRGLTFRRSGAITLAVAARNATAETSASVELPPSLPLRREGGEAWQGGGIGVFAAMAVVLGLAVLVAWGLSRRGRTGNGAVTARRLLGSLKAGQATVGVKVVQSVRLAPRSSLHVVEWGSRRLLVSSAEQGVSLIAEEAVMPPAAVSPGSGEVAP